jgi:2Fe-2S ferredoxin
MSESPVRFTMVRPDGQRLEIAAHAGETVMAAAVRNDVPGIVGECGGNLACATCHVIVDGEWQSALAPPGEQERQMLECVVDPQPHSRLACCLPLTEALSGLRVRLPESQF